MDSNHIPSHSCKCEQCKIQRQQLWRKHQEVSPRKQICYFSESCRCDKCLMEKQNEMTIANTSEYINKEDEDVKN